jgi:hypothetical protein
MDTSLLGSKSPARGRPTRNPEEWSSRDLPRTIESARFTTNKNLPEPIEGQNHPSIEGYEESNNRSGRRTIEWTCVTGRMDTGRAVRNRENQLDETRLDKEQIVNLSITYCKTIVN